MGLYLCFSLFKNTYKCSSLIYNEKILIIFNLKKAMWMMLQQEVPEDYVIATNEVHSVREFVEASFKEIGREIEYYFIFTNKDF